MQWGPAELQGSPRPPGVLGAFPGSGRTVRDRKGCSQLGQHHRQAPPLVPCKAPQDCALATPAWGPGAGVGQGAHFKD